MTDRYILHADHHLAGCLSRIRDLFLTGEIYEVIIQKYDPRRTLEQNERRWARMGWLSEHSALEGKRMSKEAWHYRLLIEVGYVSGVCPYQVGSVTLEIPIAESTSKMGRKRFSEMEERTDVWLAERGIVIPEPDEDNGSR